MQIAAGSTLAEHYDIERLLGRGGMASVWLARDSRYDRLLAVKTLDPQLTGADGAERFLREVRVTARLNHPGILPILDSGVLRGPDGMSVPWYAMPYVHGESLRARLARERQLPIDDALRITTAVGSTLAAAHAEHIVHRDIKPENVLLSGDTVYVVDFGIAKALADTQAERLTSTGLAVGTPAYMSPEQSTAESVDARSDQYSLAAMLYEMIAGEPPFSGATTAAIVARRLTERPRPLSTVRPSVPRAVEQATLRALERVPADRFASVPDFLAALRGGAASAGQAGAAKPRTRVALAAIAVAALAGVGTWGASLYLRARQLRRDPALVALYERGVREYERRTPKANDESIVIFRNLLARDSTYADAWNALAKSYIRAWTRGYTVPGVARDQILPLAVTAVDRSLMLDSTIGNAWTTLAQVRRSLDPTDLDLALRAAKRSIALDSTDGDAWENLGIIESDLGNFDEALDAWGRGARVAPGYAEGLAFLALGYYWRRNIDSAAFWADSAVHLSPSFVLGRMTAGQIYIERHDYARAQAAFEAAARLTTEVEHLNALGGLALTHASAGNAAEARRVLHRADTLAARLRPLTSHPITWLSEAYVRLGQTDRALRLLREYQPVRDLHFQLHLRCDPPFDAMRTDARFRALLVREAPAPGKGC
jgi:tetratricopeptide (TPR) repeat protein/tRNA A-37 threonylcarbamoyl transferase component Bud32